MFFDLRELKDNENDYIDKIVITFSFYGPLIYKFLCDYHFACLLFVYKGSASCNLSDPTFVSLSSACAHVHIKLCDPTFPSLVVALL